MHGFKVVSLLLDEMEAIEKILLEALFLLHGLDLVDVVLLSQLQVLVHVVERVSGHLDQQVGDLACHLLRDGVLQHRQVLAKVCTLIFHFRLGCFCLFQLDV